MKKFQVFLGLAVLVAALWAVGTPVDAEGKSLIGGWVSYTGCQPCYGTSNSNCDNGEVTGVGNCYSEVLIILLGLGNHSGTWYYPTICGGPGICGNICNSYCNM